MSASQNLRIVLAALIPVVLLISFIYNQQIAEKLITETVWRVELPTINQFRLQYGTERNLTAHDVRRLYHDVLHIGQKWYDDSVQAGASLEELAVGCNLVRYRARIYARQRQSDWYARLLPLRDVWTHCISHGLSLSSLVDTSSCLQEHPDRPCPSFAALRVRHAGNLTRITQSCWCASKTFDKLAGILPSEV